jgi:hypothetical protein
VHNHDFASNFHINASDHSQHDTKAVESLFYVVNIPKTCDSNVISVDVLTSKGRSLPPSHGLGEVVAEKPDQITADRARCLSRMRLDDTARYSSRQLDGASGCHKKSSLHVKSWVKKEIANQQSLLCSKCRELLLGCVWSPEIFR